MKKWWRVEKRLSLETMLNGLQCLAGRGLKVVRVRRMRIFEMRRKEERVEDL